MIQRRSSISLELLMARKQIKTVHLERQPHREARLRLRLAYQQLARAAKPASPPAEHREQRNVSQEDKS